MRTIKIAFLLLGMQLAITASAQMTVINADRMLNVRSGKIISPATIVIEDGLITAINPNNIPSTTNVIELGDKTLLPGLIHEAIISRSKRIV